MVLPRERSWNRWPPLFLRLQSCSSCHPFLLFRFLLLHLLVHLPPSPHLIFPMCKLAPRTIRASPSCVPELAEHSLVIAMALAMTMAIPVLLQLPVPLQLLQTHSNSTEIALHLARGKEMSLSRSIGSYYKLPKSDPNAVYLLPTAIYLLQCCFIAANIVWAGQCDNSLFPWKLYKINLTAQQTINTAIKN